MITVRANNWYCERCIQADIYRSPDRLQAGAQYNESLNNALETAHQALKTTDAQRVDIRLHCSEEAVEMIQRFAGWVLKEKGEFLPGHDLQGYRPVKYYVFTIFGNPHSRVAMPIRKEIAESPLRAPQPFGELPRMTPGFQNAANDTVPKNCDKSLKAIPLTSPEDLGEFMSRILRVQVPDGKGRGPGKDELSEKEKAQLKVAQEAAEPFLHPSGSSTNLPLKPARP